MVNYNSCTYKFDLYAYYNCNTLGNGLWLFMHFLAFSSMITLTYMISLSFLYFRWDYSIYMVYFVHLSHCISTLNFEDPQVTARLFKRSPGVHTRHCSLTFLPHKCIGSIRWWLKGWCCRGFTPMLVA